MLFVASQVLIIGVGLLPLSLWRSFRAKTLELNPPSGGKPAPAGA